MQSNAIIQTIILNISFIMITATFITWLYSWLLLIDAHWQHVLHLWLCMLSGTNDFI